MGAVVPPRAPLAAVLGRPLEARHSGADEDLERVRLVGSLLVKEGPSRDRGGEAGRQASHLRLALEDGPRQRRTWEVQIEVVPMLDRHRWRLDDGKVGDLWQRPAVARDVAEERLRRDEDGRVAGVRGPEAFDAEHTRVQCVVRAPPTDVALSEEAQAVFDVILRRYSAAACGVGTLVSERFPRQVTDYECTSAYLLVRHLP